mmetsp:Transcript_56672/g.91751  ORF Transcript_56672/g.91751 Transcript_56672/m.91751 type:complete len:213 (+) Transcript_56672:5-643(+)
MAMLFAALLAASWLPASAFMAPACTTATVAQCSAHCALRVNPAVALRSATPARRGLALCMAIDDMPSVDRSDENREVDKEPVPDTVLSNTDLDARIAALGLGTEGGVEDKSTGEDPSEKLRPMARVQKEAVKLGTTAIGSTISGVIGVLNSLEAPISEEDYLARKGVEKEKKPMAEEERTMINQGGLVPAGLIAALGLGFIYWGVGGERGWF